MHWPQPKQPLFKIATSGFTYEGKPEKMDWESFNDSFYDRELTTIEFVDMIYRGHPFCAWMGNQRRKIDNFVLAQHIAVDMDDESYESSIDALCEHPLVKTYGAILYPSPSHKPSAPRTRVVFLLDKPIEKADAYRLAIEVIYSLFEGSDPACVDSARFFYGNGKLRTQSNPEAIWFSENICLPLADLRMFARQFLQNRKMQLEEKQKQAVQIPDNGNVHPTGNGDKPTLDEVGNMLDKVDPYNLDYTMWLKMVAALKHEYGDSAFWVAKKWSDRPGKEPLTEKKWESLRQQHSRPATIATVYKVVQDYAR